MILLFYVSAYASIVILSKRCLRNEEPVPNEVEGIWASRANGRVFCDRITRAWLASFGT